MLVSFVGWWLWRAGYQILHSLDEKESKLQSLVDNAADGFITINEHGLIVTVSYTAQSILGYSMDELIDQDISKIVHKASALHQDTHSKLKNNDVINLHQETLVQRKDGSLFPVELSISEYHRDDKLFFTWIFRDLSNLKNTQKKLKILDDDAHELRLKLAHVDRVSLMGEMASGIAHEINQPLTAITNYVQASLRMLDSQSFNNEEIHEVLQKTITQTTRAASIIKQMRRFVKKQDGEKTVCDCNQLIIDAGTFIQTDLKIKRFKINNQLSGAALPIFVDQVLFQQVLINLINNAIESMSEVADKNTRSINVSSKNIGQKWVEIKVEDFGSGIDEDKRGKIFAPYFTTKSKGMGMGLSISESIINAHNGSLKYQPNLPNGSIFIIRFPLEIDYSTEKMSANREATANRKATANN